MKNLQSPNTNINIKFIFGLFLFIFFMLFIIKSSVFEFYRIPSESMQPELNPGEIILVSKIHYFIKLPLSDYKKWYKEPKAGDIIAFNHENENLVKRIRAVPGDEVIKNKKEVILPAEGTEITLNYKNLELYRDLIIKEDNTVMSNGNDCFINGIKQDIYKFKYHHYYVLGDNLSSSIDSRDFGTITSNQIIGVPIIKITGKSAPKFLLNYSTSD